jgi:hypothetical protein
MGTYQELKDKQPELVECFFAFDKKQYNEGVAKHNLFDKKLYSTGMGLVGTYEGIKAFEKFYDDQSAQIAAECDPQEVYDHEFNNHECGYLGDDKEAIDIVVEYFGIEKATTVKRRCAYHPIINPLKEESHV